MNHRGASVEVLADRLRIARPGKQPFEVSLAGRGSVTAHALSTGGTSPRLALATVDMGIPTLAVFDLDSGKEASHLVGHTQIVTRLDWSNDGNRLVSVGLDQTVRLWSLAHFADLIGKRGRMQGLVVEQREAGLFVQELREGATKQMAIGDRIASAEVDGKELTWGSLDEFYRTWWTTSPGTAVRLKADRNNQAIMVPITIDQGIEIRMPLLTWAFFENGDVIDWVAWSPFGAFESSDEAIESRLGWQFNGTRSREPVSIRQAGGISR